MGGTCLSCHWFHSVTSSLYMPGAIIKALSEVNGYRKNLNLEQKGTLKGKGLKICIIWK